MEDLIHLRTLRNREEAERLRDFLQSRGVTGILLVNRILTPEQATLTGRHEDLFSVLVPATEFAKAVSLLDYPAESREAT